MGEYSIGIITFNSEKYIDDLFDSILHSSILPVRIVVVDNNSQDKTISLIEKYQKDLPINLIRNKENRGHSPAMNQILDHVETRYVVLQDHDTVVESDCYQYLLKELASSSSKTCAITAVIDTVSKYGGKRVFGQDLHYLISSVPRFEYLKKEVGICPTTCVMIDREKLSDLRFDEDMFIYQNDYDYFYRARIIGLELGVCDMAFVLHKDGTPGVSGRKGQKYSSLRTFYINRNRWLFFLKNYSLGTLFLLSPALFIYEVIAFLFAILKGNFLAYIRAKIDFLFKVPKYFGLRRKAQRDREISDFDILASGPMGLSESAVNDKFKSIAQTINDIFDSYFMLIRKISGSLR